MSVRRLIDKRDAEAIVMDAFGGFVTLKEALERLDQLADAHALAEASARWRAALLDYVIAVQVEAAVHAERQPLRLPDGRVVMISDRDEVERTLATRRACLRALHDALIDLAEVDSTFASEHADWFVNQAEFAGRSMAVDMLIARRIAEMGLE